LEYRSNKTSLFVLKSVAFAAACLWGTHASALGLGRLNVQSALGEALRAEIEVTSMTAEEASSLKLRVAPPEAYRAAGVEYNPVLPSAQVRVARRPDGSNYLRVTSDRAVLEPFIDVIVEATWSSGRLVREYTLLFDPPVTRTAQPTAPSAAPVVSAAPAITSPVSPTPSGSPIVQAPTPAPSPAPAPMARPATPPRAAALSAAAPAPAAPAPVPAATAAAGGDTYRVRAGESLTRIAARTQRPGISLDQMLVSLFRGNPQAFMGENMNRLKSGAVLAVPSAEQAAKLSPESAREVVLAQSSDFNAYRQRLATGVAAAPVSASARQVKGQVRTQVEDRKSASSATPDKLTLSQGGVKPGAPEVKATKEAEKKSEATRLAELNRNVEELKKLQGNTAAAPAVLVAPAAAPAAAPPAAPAPAPAPAPVAVAPVPAPTAVAPVQVPASPKPVAAVPAPAPQEQGGFLDGLMDNALLLPGAGVLVALLAGLGLYRLRGRMRKPAGETSFLESRLQPDSFFGASGGQRVDTREASANGSSGNSSSMSYSMSQLDAIGDVDPVAEADVYLAYGRDLQAEEILKEAMRAAPERMAIRTKLLEVYAKRRDTKAFELLATQLYNLTRGEGEDWAKAQAMGQSIDPSNELYAVGGGPDGERSGDGQPLPDALGAATQPYTAPLAPPSFQPASDATLDGGIDLDLDLDLDLPGTPPTATGFEPSAPAPFRDVEATQPYSVPAAARPQRIGDTQDLSSDNDMARTTAGTRPMTPPPAAPAAPSTPANDDMLDFDLDTLDADPRTVAMNTPGSESTPAAAADNSLDFGDFDLGGAPSIAMDMTALSRKLELAEEFRQIGDVDGARDLLEEVVAKADGALKAKAQGMLDQLARS